MPEHSGLFVGWYDVDPQLLPEINIWHSGEHMPERFQLPGFVSAQRYRSLDRENAYCVLYRTQTPDSFVSRPYLDVLNNPTPWTQRMMPGLLNLNRTLCHVEFSVGQQGCGGYLVTARPSGGSEVRGLNVGQLEQEISEKVAHFPGLARVEFAVADHRATTKKTNEKNLRKTPDEMSDWVFLVECYPDKEACSEIIVLVLDTFHTLGGGETELHIDYFKLDHAIF